jgi:hypothetical protein
VRLLEPGWPSTPSPEATGITIPLGYRSTAGDRESLDFLNTSIDSSGPSAQVGAGAATRRVLGTGLARPCAGIHRLVDGQEDCRLLRAERSAATDLQRNRGHRHVVGSFPEGEAVVCEGVPEPMELPTDDSRWDRAASRRSSGLPISLARVSGV